jgi:predicted RNA binding protein YcfA (HicA-like mRNA interferase family)
MPKLPILSGAEVVRALQQLGFKQVRQRGSHVVLRRGSVGCVVPLHKEVKLGTLANIIRQAQLTPAEFVSAVNN